MPPIAIDCHRLPAIATLIATLSAPLIAHLMVPLIAPLIASLLRYRMARPHATDTSSLSYNSAIFCRIAVMLVFNTNLLVLPSEV